MVVVVVIMVVVMMRQELLLLLLLLMKMLLMLNAFALVILSVKPVIQITLPPPHPLCSGRQHDDPRAAEHGRRDAVAQHGRH